MRACRRIDRRGNMVYRTWFCLNRHCLHEFTVVDAMDPPCPRCGNTKVKWIPGTTGALSNRTRNIDATVKELKQTYGDKNYNSPRLGERTAPKINPSLTPGHTAPFAPAPGWGMDIPVDRNGRPGMYCGPVSPGALPGAGRWGAGLPKVKLRGPTPRIEASHRPRKS